MDLTVIPILGILFPIVIISVVFVFVIILRIFSHRERMAMIAKGIAPPGEDEAAARTPQSQLEKGLVTTLVGLALLVGLGTIGIGPWLLGGLIPMFVGIAYLISYFATNDREKQGPEG
ncbi:MAG: hypothetical protein C4575_10260 [Desulforudis sp.]|jgi:sterol desaturase/sphingolipid hydroxylase (fatty acid hydroxylase superfamily)|nr:MAG: hypothetical protein C4575_10260 [Desulforudis sp.]